jgi:hypothetical protein
MIKKSILKAALVILIALTMILPVSAISTKTRTVNVISSNPVTMDRDNIFEDGFETYDDWLTDFPPWTCIDVDGDPTFGHNQINWPHENEPYAFIIFNPDTTVPPQTAPEFQPHTGDKMAMAINDNNVGFISDDWLITPKLSGSYGTVSFWAHSYSNQYHLENITVCVSTTDMDPASFTMISPTPCITLPLAWTEYSFDISSYAGQDIYIGIHYISVDSWMGFIDDFKVTEGDATPPVTTCILEGTMEGDVYTSDVTVTLTATDDLSGVNYTMYKIDGGAWTTYSAPFVVSGKGNHTVAFYSVDMIGNIEAEKVQTFTIRYPIEITITGGLGISVTIKNVGTAALSNISWSITLDGKLIFVGKTKSDVIPTLASGDEVTVKDFVIGFGKTGIAITVGSMEGSASGTVILFFVIGVK